MEFNHYQAHARYTAIYPHDDGVIYCILGLIGESGEVANKWKKLIRDNADYNATERAIKDELGDVLWYIANLATELGCTLDEIASNNLGKLVQRQSKGTLSGSGDNR